MPTATVVKAWKDPAQAHLAIKVAEGGSAGMVEYIGSVRLDALAGLMPAAQKAALLAAAKAIRDRQIGGLTDLAGIAGTVSI